MTTQLQDYFRRDQASGVTAPDLSKDCSYPEYIVRTRVKRTQFTSVSLDPKKINIFGPTLYRTLQTNIDEDGHAIVEHADLIRQLRSAAASTKKEERARALQAQRYAKRRQEGLIKWNFTLEGVDRKDLTTWALRNVQQYFGRAAISGTHCAEFKVCSCRLTLLPADQAKTPTMISNTIVDMISISIVFLVLGAFAL